MTAHESLQALQSFVQDTPQPTLHVALAARPSPTDLAVHRLSLAQTVASSLFDVVSRCCASLDEVVLTEYQAGYKPEPHELLYLPIDEYQNIRPTVDALTPLDDLALFEEDDGFLDHLKFYVFALQKSGPQQALFFTRTTRRLELSRRFPHAVMFGRGTFNRIGQKILLFEEDADCFAWDGYLYVRSVGAFQAIFGFFEELRQRAARTIDAVVARVPISNEDEFRAACGGQVQMLAKLSSIADKDYLQTLTMDSIKQVVTDYGLAITLAEDEDGLEGLVFEPQANRRWLILKLLDDDYLGSEMTSKRYETNSKLAVG